MLANAAHVKNVPGRKTDVNDAMWLAELLAHGLIRASFVPDTQTQEMRNLLRTRKQLVREQSSHVLRVQKTLEDANIKLDSVLSDLMGKSGRAMIEALIAGETNPAKLAALADRRVKASHEEFREALRGRVTKHHRFLLRLHLNQIDALDAAMATLDTQVEANLGPFRTAVELIMSIPGIKNLGAHVIVSEIGIDMSRFPSEGHLISWANMCPGNDESAGKRRSNRLRKGAPWLKTTLVQCAWAAVKKKNSYLQAQFYRIKVRRGPKKAIMAVAASILTAIYHMAQGWDDVQGDLGCNHFDRRSTDNGKNNAWLNASLNLGTLTGDQADPPPRAVFAFLLSESGIFNDVRLLRALKNCSSYHSSTSALMRRGRRMSRSLLRELREGVRLQYEDRKTQHLVAKTGTTLPGQHVLFSRWRARGESANVSYGDRRYFGTPGGRRCALRAAQSELGRGSHD